MMTMDTLTTFLGWSSVINISLLSLSAAIISIWKEPIARLHSKLFGLNPDEVKLIYFQYLGIYKIAILMLNLAPYVALKIIT